MLLAAAGLGTAVGRAVEVPPPVAVGPEGRLAYRVDPDGDRVPDFSEAGYRGGGQRLPEVPVRVVVMPVPGDNGPRIQAAIDYVSGLPADREGRRGAVLLRPGRYEVDGQLRIGASGVVLRGSGADDPTGARGTVLVAAGTGRRPLILVQGREDRVATGPDIAVVGARVAVGAVRLDVADASGLHPGETVLIRRPSPRNWIADIGMNVAPGPTFYSWKPGTIDVCWDRVIEAVRGNGIVLDAPLTTALESRYGGGTVTPYFWPGRLREVGIEGLRCESTFDPANSCDEQHSWMAIDLEAVENAWVRRVTAVHFASSLVQVGFGCKWVTVEDCDSLAPVSEVAGYRRNTYHTDGQLTLFLRCRAEAGRNDFTVGYMSAGPNVFLDCSAARSSGFSGSIGDWASGILFDNVNIDEGALRLDNLEIWNQGVGWAAVNSMAWQTSASRLVCRKPPGANNWAVGDWGEFVGDGRWTECNDFVKPVSLYEAQLRDRIGDAAVRALEPQPIPSGAGGAPGLEQAVPDLAARLAPNPRPAGDPLAVRNGWLEANGRILIGRQYETAWWRGSMLPDLAPGPGPALTRFAPGRTGVGLTDDLNALADWMKASGIVAFRQNRGLWYDERSDDHERTRRPDSEVWPPFYEQPWLRSGLGVAWDRLSRYDLSRFNPWYFGRLKAFAELAREKGLVLIDQMYFQHNLLEDGAHWANYPWRPANNINPVGFPEPPPYVDGKWLILANQFYDLSNPVRRALNEAYIRHCLANLEDEPNVIHLTGEEFTGPLSFERFWLDTAAAWSAQTGFRPILGLSTTKDVQDAILEDPKRGPLVSVIDLKYWWRTRHGLFAPEGGRQKSPRQSERKWRKARPTALDVAAMVREYRRRFPDKAIITEIDGADGWAFVAAGGSLPKLPPATDPRLLAAIARMLPVDNPPGAPKEQWVLAQPGVQYFAYSATGAVTIDLTDCRGPMVVHAISLTDGRLVSEEPVLGGSVATIASSSSSAQLGPAWAGKGEDGSAARHGKRGRRAGGAGPEPMGGAAIWITR